VDHRPDVGRIKKRTRELSKSLLGTQLRAEVAAYIATGEAPFWARAIAHQLGVPENKVSAELSRFADNDLLAAMDIAAWDRRRLYETTARSSSFWSAGLDIVRQAAEEEALRVGVGPDTALQAYLDEVHRDTETSEQRR
jgi:hypothetical protein